jgi:hypothetical protein
MHAAAAQSLQFTSCNAKRRADLISKRRQARAGGARFSDISFV